MPDETTEPVSVQSVLTSHIQRMAKIQDESRQSTEALCDLNIILIHTVAMAEPSEEEKKLAIKLLERIAAV